MADVGPDAGKRILALVVAEVEKRLKEDPGAFKAADFEFVRKLLADNSITLASVQRGDFGELAQSVAEQFPFKEGEEEGGGPTFQ
jgi:hypothetical protein